ncbi:hypothetical protein ACJX0J_009685 [Zea mays]
MLNACEFSVIFCDAAGLILLATFTPIVLNKYNQYKYNNVVIPSFTKSKTKLLKRNQSYFENCMQMNIFHCIVFVILKKRNKITKMTFFIHDEIFNSHTSKICIYSCRFTNLSMIVLVVIFLQISHYCNSPIKLLYVAVTIKIQLFIEIQYDYAIVELFA